MSKKTNRLTAMRDIISKHSVSSQEELLGKLKDIGIDATQSTLSRDIKELGAIKVPHPEKGYAYMMPELLQSDPNDKIPSHVIDNIVNIAFSGNLAVIKTKPGYANAIAILIDNIDYPFIVGTIAGDDNIFIVMTDDADQETFRHRLSYDYPYLMEML